MSDIESPKFEFDLDEDGSLTLESAILQAIGAASVCWKPMNGTGIFDSDQARAICDALLEKIRTDRLPSSVFSGQIVDIGPECFTNGEVISYKGDNFYRACDAFVTDLEGGGQSFCVKRVGHPGNIHEDYDGECRED